ncbi:protein sprint-like [Trichogramma pretiosum]|uniref:protein sprint-like n=1 Tax=Trichogramma pretiosum TaxID=7493 RepID=UPI000C71C180|nr:protein sprint-like [Trichogramma pretiosum]XP_023313749.1 protein sprint-like [Trichogramma pretiosum]
MDRRESVVQIAGMRPFVSGMKSYLVKHGEREFEKEVEKERLKLEANEFLNLDAILEDVMIRLVMRPLREHVYDLFVKHYAENGSLKTLAENLRQAQNQSLHDLGASPKILPPSAESLDNILKYFEKLQYVDSPLEKLDYSLDAIYAIHNAVKHANAGRSDTLAADDLLPIVVWVLIQGKIFDAGIEAEFMWDLIHQHSLVPYNF